MIQSDKVAMRAQCCRMTVSGPDGFARRKIIKSPAELKEAANDPIDMAEYVYS